MNENSQYPWWWTSHVGGHCGRSHPVPEGMHVGDAHNFPVIATDNECTGRVCRNPLLRSNDPFHQAQSPFLDRTGLRTL